MRVLFPFKNTGDFGVELLSACLKRAGHETGLIFDPGGADYIIALPFLKLKNVEELMVEKARRFQPDLVCFSTLTNLYPWVLNLATVLKRELNNVPVIAGGIHATALPERFLEHPAIDMLCIGEGEEALLELLAEMQAGKLSYAIRNLWCKKPDGSIVRNPVRPPIHDLDTLPFADKALFAPYGVTTHRLYAMTGRGCPFSCTYCCNQVYLNMYRDLGKFCRQKSPEYAIREIEFHLKQFPKVTEIYFYDEIFTLNKEFLREFCAKYKERVKVSFRFFVRPGFADREMLELLRDAGGRHVTMGVECGNERILQQVLKRNITKQDIIDTARMVREAGLTLTTLNILGFPGETPENMWETVELNRALKPDGACVGALFPYPGTAITASLIADGLLDADRMHDVWKTGRNSYQDTVLKHPHEDAINHTKRFFSLLVCLTPRWLDPLMKKLPPWGVFGLLNIFFMGTFSHFYYKASDLFHMIRATKKHLGQFRPGRG